MMEVVPETDRPGMAEALIAGALPDARTVRGLVSEVLDRFRRILG